MASSNQALWQHPYVDVFKHFKVIAPGADWKSNKKTGQVEETFVSDIPTFANLFQIIGQRNRKERFEHSRKYFCQ
jgi:hypothetical protein